MEIMIPTDPNQGFVVRSEYHETETDMFPVMGVDGRWFVFGFFILMAQKQICGKPYCPCNQKFSIDEPLKDLDKWDGRNPYHAIYLERYS